LARRGETVPRYVAADHQKRLFRKVFVQIALLDAVLEVVRVGQGGHEMQADGDVDAGLARVNNNSV
jgi:hypothetical protein